MHTGCIKGRAAKNLTDPIFTDANAAREHLETLHWPQGPFCPHCGSVERITKMKGKSTRPGVHRCNACAKFFTVTVGTIFEDSKIPLNKWLLAFRLMSASKKGMSAHQMHRSLGITYKSAWFLCHRIREAMNGTGNDGPLGGENIVVEADETYVGGKAKNRAFRIDPDSHGFRLLQPQGSRSKRVHALSRAYPERVCAQSAVGAGVAVTANYRNSGQNKPQFGAHEVDDALPVLTDVK